MGETGENGKNKNRKRRGRDFCILMAVLCLWGICAGGDVRAEETGNVTEGVWGTEGVLTAQGIRVEAGVRAEKSVRDGRKLEAEESARKRLKILFEVSVCGIAVVLCGIGFLDKKNSHKREDARQPFLVTWHVL